MTVESTDPDSFWCVGFLETLFMRIWYPITVATISYNVKQLIKRYIQETSDVPEELAFKLHDFGSRGVSSMESAGIGGMSHLVNFMGSDTVNGVEFARRYYNCSMAGFSIPAAEHSTITSWGKNNEAEAYRNMLKQFAKPGSLVAVVSDSYDLNHAVEYIWGTLLRDDVINSGATVVIRPDSGNPISVVMNTLNALSEKFGVTKNSKGYFVLNHVRVIQGDGIDPMMIELILEEMKRYCFSATNVAFGMGGGLLQKLDRDTFKFAYKCSSVRIKGQLCDVFKQPKTDYGKTSKAGLLELVSHKDKGIMSIKRSDCWDHLHTKLMDDVFLNGKLLREISFDQVRENTLKELK